MHARAPASVRDGIAARPAWLEVIDIETHPAADLSALDPGERDTIALGLATGAALLLMDDRAGVLTARKRGFTVTGTLGLLDLAARSGLLDLAAAFERLKATSFYYRQGVLDALLSQHDGKPS